MKTQQAKLWLIGIIAVGAMLLAPACQSLPTDTENGQPTATATARTTSVATPTKTTAPAATPAPQSTEPAPQDEDVTPTEAPTAVSADGAVQSLLGYFEAINQQEYARAYEHWAEAGAASGQTLDQFEQGYADTVRVTVQLGEPEGQSGHATPAATIPVTITAVVNDSASEPLGQRVQRFQGTYTLQFSAVNSAPTTWHIISASVDEVTDATLPSVDVSEPLTVLQSYFEAINAREYARAYTYWNDLGQASQQSFAEFRQGFDTTERVSIELGDPEGQGAAGTVFSDVPVVIVATQSDGSTKTFEGVYTLSRPNVPPFYQFGWRIASADIAVTAGQ